MKFVVIRKHPHLNKLGPFDISAVGAVVEIDDDSLRVFYPQFNALLNDRCILIVGEDHSKKNVESKKVEPSKEPTTTKTVDRADKGTASDNATKEPTNKKRKGKGKKSTSGK